MECDAMSGSAFVDDEDYPFAEWAQDMGIDPDPFCAMCAGEGVVAQAPCACMVTSTLMVLPGAAGITEPVEGCARCDGDGADVTGQMCPCLLVAIREKYED